MYLKKEELKQFLALANMYLAKYSWKDLEKTRDKIVGVIVND